MKAHREDWKKIYVLKTTHQRRDLDIQTAAQVRLRLSIWPDMFGAVREMNRRKKEKNNNNNNNNSKKKKIK